MRSERFIGLDVPRGPSACPDGEAVGWTSMCTRREMTRLMIEAIGLHKSFGETHALAGLDFDVKEGTILCVLGLNGAGKTTAVRVLTTPPIRTAAAPRRCASTCSVTRRKAPRSALRGSTRPSTSCSPVARTSGWSAASTASTPATVKARADALLERFELTDAADRP